MVDLSEKGSESEDMNISSEEGQRNEAKKSCADCGTTKTPLWRGGPAGPKVITCQKPICLLSDFIHLRIQVQVVLGYISPDCEFSFYILSAIQTLCNACGIRYRKKRRAVLGFNKGGPEREKKPAAAKNKKLGVSLKQLRLLTLRREVWLERWTIAKQRKLGEEEQAAVLLMALSMHRKREKET
uniref:GATA-type domain-containing protein n=1 Tax=Nelumbo nucifera TaxID=4432 RepID=A0A822Z5A8_NELNU|nr:TPA_asm: hypothetical protein HUJ06_008827 [Nelumbo nucifera]